MWRVLFSLFVLVASACRQPAPEPWGPGSGRARPSRVDLRVRGRPQGHSLSCESRSAVDLLGHSGISVTEDAFLAGLPRSDNPHLGFVGDVDGPGEQLPPAGYGVYAEPVAARLRELGFAARAYAGVDLGWLKDQLAARRPVIVWATGTLGARERHTLVDGKGCSFVAVRGEHTFLAVGYLPGELLLLDPATGRTKLVFERRFDAAWATLGRTAVTGDPVPNATRP